MDDVFWQIGMTLADAEKRIILKCLRFHGGNQTKTAAALGVSARTIANKLKEYGVEPVDPMPEEAPAPPAETPPEGANERQIQKKRK